MTRWGAWNSRNLELLAESQRLYDGVPSPYYLEFVRKFCCVVCKKEIRQGCFYQASAGLQWHVGCLKEVEEGDHEPPQVAQLPGESTA